MIIRGKRIYTPEHQYCKPQANAPLHHPPTHSPTKKISENKLKLYFWDKTFLGPAQLS